jgi:hypothetical protein
VAGDVMLPVVLRLRAFQELCMDILEALRANPGDAGLCVLTLTTLPNFQGSLMESESAP